MDRRSFIAMAASTLVASGSQTTLAAGVAGDTSTDGTAKSTALYASLGPRLVRINATATSGSEAILSGVDLPASVQYAAAHPSSKYLYVATSTAGPGGMSGNDHYLSALAIDPKSGDLSPIGATIKLPYRPIHTMVDPSGQHVLVACPNPGTVLVFPIEPNGTLGNAVQQAEPIKGGNFVHQVRVFPSGETVISCARGNDPTAAKLEDIGSFSTFAFMNGALTPAHSRQLQLGDGPRSIDFHPHMPLAYVAMERGNSLQVFRVEDERLGDQPIFVKEVLQNLENKKRIRQRVGAGITHPGGRFFYTVNRADKTKDVGGQQVFAGGENNIAVYALDEKTGEPTLIQHLSCEGVEPRTIEFIDDGGQLVIGNQTGMIIKSDTGSFTVRPNIAFFTIAVDGRLTHTHKLELDAGPQGLVWMGAVTLRI